MLGSIVCVLGSLGSSKGTGQERPAGWVSWGIGLFVVVLGGVGRGEGT